MCIYTTCVYIYKCFYKFYVFYKCSSIFTNQYISWIVIITKERREFLRILWRAVLRRSSLKRTDRRVLEACTI